MIDAENNVSPGLHTLSVNVPSGYSFDYYHYVYTNDGGYISGGYLYSNPASLQVTSNMAVTAVFSPTSSSFQPAITGPNLLINDSGDCYYVQPQLTYANTTYAFNVLSSTPDGTNPLYAVDCSDNSGYTYAWSSVGTPVLVNHSWSSVGEYTVWAAAYDYGSETWSPMSQLNVTMLWQGDLNGDGVVNAQDFFLFTNMYIEYFSTPSVYNVFNRLLP